MKRTEIAIRGAPSTEALRLELSGQPGEEGLVLEFLHDDRQTGTLARVLGGWVGLGEVSVPVAVKLQRDIALSQEDRSSVAAKFDKERNVHRHLQNSVEDTSGQERIVRQLEVWKSADDYQSLAERLECGPSLVECYQTFIHTLRDKLLRPWDRALRGRRLFLFRRHSVHVPLSRAERSAFRSDELGDALDRLETAVRDGVTARKGRAADFEGALARWRASFAGHSWLDALTWLESDALRQRRDIEAASDTWDYGWSEAINRLRNWLAETNALLSNYEQLLSTNPYVEEVSARLTRMQREPMEPTVCGEAVLWLQRNWPAPSDKLEAVFALSELGLADS